MFASLILAAGIQLPIIIAQAFTPGAYPNTAPPPTPTAPVETQDAPTPGVYAPSPYRRLPGSVNLGNANGATVISSGTPLHILVAAIASRAHLAYRILALTPDVPERFASRGADDLKTLSDLLAPDGLVSYVQNSTLYVGSAPAMDATLGTKFTKTAFIPTNGISPTLLVARSAAFAPPGLVLLPDTLNMGVVARGTPSAIKQLQDSIGNVDSVPYATHTIPLQNGIDPTRAVAIITKLAPPSAPNTIIPDPYSNAILIYGTDSFYNAVQNILTNIDKPLWTVFYSVSIYEIDPDSFNSLRGLQIGQSQTSYQAIGTTAIGQQSAPNSGSIIFGFPIARTLNINAQLDELESKGQAAILRRADIRTTNGVSGTTDYLANTGFLVPNSYTGINEPRTVQTGVTFTVEPFVGVNTLTTNVTVSISNVTGYGTTGLPNTVSRDTKTQVVSNFDDTIIISGLYADDKLDSRTGIPPLNHIPLISSLTGHHQYTHQETDLIVVLTPHILRNTTDRPDTVVYPNVPANVIQNGLDNPNTSAPSAKPKPTSPPSAPTTTSETH
jgi:hypothetical protein